MKEEKQQLQKKCEQQEQTLQEMGLHLSQSVLPSLLSTSSSCCCSLLPSHFLIKGPN